MAIPLGNTAYNSMIISLILLYSNESSGIVLEFRIVNNLLSDLMGMHLLNWDRYSLMSDSLLPTPECTMPVSSS